MYLAQRFISDDQVVLSMQQVIAILGEDSDGSIKVEVMGEAQDLDLYKEELYSSDFRIEMDTEPESGGCPAQTITLPAIAPDEILKRPNEFEILTSENNGDFRVQPQVFAGAPASLSVLDWLASVTETINLSMHYGFPTSPQPLVFLVPLHFFNFLMDRISGGSSHKKRLPNSTESFARTSTPPLGRFTRYTWHLTNIFLLKKVFDTPTVTLEISRRFVKSANNTFQVIEPGPSIVDSTDISEYNKGHKKVMMAKPTNTEYKTFLKVKAVGNSEQLYRYTDFININCSF